MRPDLEEEHLDSDPSALMQVNKAAHKVTDTHTSAYTPVSAVTSKHAQQALGAGEGALEPGQGVTNNCSSLDMQDGPTVNLPDTVVQKSHNRKKSCKPSVKICNVFYSSLTR